MKRAFGVGINDADYPVVVQVTISRENGVRRKKNVYQCKAYRNWYNMLHRCYSSKFQERSPSYNGCSVCPEWLTFSNFKKWHDIHYVDEFHLDKDVIKEDNKIYSPDTCSYVPVYINSLLTDHRSARGDCPLGVSWSVRDKRYVAQCSVDGRIKALGRYGDPLEAHFAWIRGKTDHVEDVIRRYSSESGADKRVIDALENFIKKMKSALETRTEIKTM